MDIEGSEVEALKGAVDLIRKNKPQLALSIYHNEDDLVDIPLLDHLIIGKSIFIVSVAQHIPLSQVPHW